jgi:hypothetical protein
MVEALLLYWLVYATSYSVDYTGPFATRAICEAARQEAARFGMAGTDCVTGEQYDDYLEDMRDKEEKYGGPY